MSSVIGTDSCYARRLSAAPIVNHMRAYEYVYVHVAGNSEALVYMLYAYT